MLVDKALSARDVSTRIRVAHGTADRLYLGHVLEHIAWDKTLELLAEMRVYLCEPGAELMIVGPDMDRILNGWKRDKYDNDLVESTIELDVHYQEGDHPDPEAARHQWNCTESRLIRALNDTGWFHVEAVSLEVANVDWPLVATNDWQCAVQARA